MHFRYQSGEQIAEITLERIGDGFQALINGQSYTSSKCSTSSRECSVCAWMAAP